MTVIKRGLDIPVAGAPEQHIEPARHIDRVGLIGDDYIGMKPTMMVQEGERVQLGQPVFEDKKTPGVLYTAPAAGTVVEINRGRKRKFQSLVIQAEGDEAVAGESHSEGQIAGLGRDKISASLLSIGLWPSLRTRPFGRVPRPGSVPHAIFVQAIDTNPLAADPTVVLAGREHHFTAGLAALAQLTDGTVYVCKSPQSSLAGEGVSGVRFEEFSGPHPAGLPGTHIHFLEPVGPNKTVWYLNCQDVAAIGAWFLTGRLDARRVIALGGPQVERPRLLETRLGVDILQLTEGELVEDTNRIISGSILHGRTIASPVQYLGRYAQQVSVIKEGHVREFLGWQKPGFEKFSIIRVFASSVSRGKRFRLTTSTEGSERAMVPIGTYERVMPLDMLPTPLLRALIVRDTDSAQQLGALELEEEDLALCTFVCPGKYEYGSILRDNLRKIEVEG